MEMQTPSPPPKNLQNSQPQAMQSLKDSVQKAGQMGIQPDKFVQLGQFASQAIKDQTLYPIFKQGLIKSGLAQENELPQGVDMKLLAQFVALGKVAEKMIGGMQ